MKAIARLTVLIKSEEKRQQNVWQKAFQKLDQENEKERVKEEKKEQEMKETEKVSSIRPSSSDTKQTNTAGKKRNNKYNRGGNANTNTVPEKEAQQTEKDLARVEEVDKDEDAEVKQTQKEVEEMANKVCFMLLKIWSSNPSLDSVVGCGA